MALARHAQSDFRFFLAVGIAGTGFLSTLVVLVSLAQPGVLAIIMAFAVGYGVLMALSRTAYFGGAIGRTGDGLSAVPSLLISAAVLYWTSGATDIYDQLGAVNAGAAPSPTLFQNVAAIGLLLVAGVVAGTVLGGARLVPLTRLHIILAANAILLGYAMIAQTVPGLPAAPDMVLPFAAIALMALGYLRWAIQTRASSDRAP